MARAFLSSVACLAVLSLSSLSAAGALSPAGAALAEDLGAQTTSTSLEQLAARLHSLSSVVATGVRAHAAELRASGSKPDTDTDSGTDDDSDDDSDDDDDDDDDSSLDDEALCKKRGCQNGVCRIEHSDEAAVLSRKAVCVCTMGWSGKRCDKPRKCSDYCQHGKCTSAGTTGVCHKCEPGWGGTGCHRALCTAEDQVIVSEDECILGPKAGVRRTTIAYKPTATCIDPAVLPDQPEDVPTPPQHTLDLPCGCSNSRARIVPDMVSGPCLAIVSPQDPRFIEGRQMRLPVPLVSVVAETQLARAAPLGTYDLVDVVGPGSPDTFGCLVDASISSVPPVQLDACSLEGMYPPPAPSGSAATFADTPDEELPTPVTLVIGPGGALSRMAWGPVSGQSGSQGTEEPARPDFVTTAGLRCLPRSCLLNERSEAGAVPGAAYGDCAPVTDPAQCDVNAIWQHDLATGALRIRPEHLPLDSIAEASFPVHVLPGQPGASVVVALAVDTSLPAGGSIPDSMDSMQVVLQRQAPRAPETGSGQAAPEAATFETVYQLDVTAVNERAVRLPLAAHPAETQHYRLLVRYLTSAIHVPGAQGAGVVRRLARDLSHAAIAGSRSLAEVYAAAQAAAGGRRDALVHAVVVTQAAVPVFDSIPRLEGTPLPEVEDPPPGEGSTEPPPPAKGRNTTAVLMVSGFCILVTSFALFVYSKNRRERFDTEDMLDPKNPGAPVPAGRGEMIGMTPIRAGAAAGAAAVAGSARDGYHRVDSWMASDEDEEDDMDPLGLHSADLHHDEQQGGGLPLYYPSAGAAAAAATPRSNGGARLIIGGAGHPAAGAPIPAIPPPPSAGSPGGLLPPSSAAGSGQFGTGASVSPSETAALALAPTALEADDPGTETVLFDAPGEDQLPEQYMGFDAN
ncbi:hypothetical protein H696_04469 [Fonticula alba]|uniref:EGF-like domain-containing protein n=1 Tax=Fonticula alba TaxID=691883 RepID=A0A058Z4L4_FONAL|nr:hypothetical protein H696_04469 [Fonticula alba]KCV69051.1 hypothetical protein H696_04469 [Fonticula alba]|eukprot:XP_009496622.1 hypothetical protein H696_04469 [Fonticula alba]